MIKVQVTAISSINNPSSARTPYQPSSESRISASRRPQSCRSEASYATFASSTKAAPVPVARNHNQFQAKVNKMVPKLEIGATYLKTKV